MAASMRLVHHLQRRNMRRQRIFRDRSNPLDMYNDIELIERFRFPRAEILQLVDEYGDMLKFRVARKGALPPSMMLMIALRFYASGSFQQVIGDIFGASKMTVQKVIERVSSVLDQAMSDEITFDRQPLANQTKTKFYAKAGFPGVIGCIDCTHVKILAPSSPAYNESEFVNRKGYHSINVQLVCDADLKILNAVSKWPGSVHDARILRRSVVFDAFEDNPPPLDGYLLGDSGYMLKPWLLTPYIHPKGRSKRFNTAHSSTRATIERCNGVLKRRWHSLHGELRYAPDKACRIISSCILLHNKAIAFKLPEPRMECTEDCNCDDHNDDTYDDGCACSGADGQGGGLVCNLDGRIVRDEIAEAYFGR